MSGISDNRKPKSLFEERDKGGDTHITVEETTKPNKEEASLSFLSNIIFHVSLCGKHFFELIIFLRNCTRTWLYVLGKLILFTVILIPGWIQMLWYYFFHPSVLKNIPFGKGAKFRNLLDVYLPQPLLNKENASPVIVFVSGGAWIIGYKLWGCLVARAFSLMGCLVITPDYRNFPQGRLSDMKEDIREAILWTKKNCASFGGDVDNIILIGQSAGAHISLSLLIDEHLRKEKAAAADSARVFLDDAVIKMCIGISGPYNLVALESHLHARGLDASLLKWVCDNDLKAHSPYLALQNFVSFKGFPQLALVHGSSDKTIPYSESTDLANLCSILKWEKPVETHILSGWSHTDAILEGPMTGDFRSVEGIVDIIKGRAFNGDQKSSKEAARFNHVNREGFYEYFKKNNGQDRAFVPSWLGMIARKINPF